MPGSQPMTASRLTWCTTHVAAVPAQGLRATGPVSAPAWTALPPPAGAVPARGTRETASPLATSAVAASTISAATRWPRNSLPGVPRRSHRRTVVAATAGHGGPGFVPGRGPLAAR